MKKWEYLTVTQCKSEDLNKLGLEGWELINIILPFDHRIDATNKRVNDNLCYVFKRQIL